MARFTQLKLTDSGRDLLARMISEEKKLHIEELLIGDGHMPAGMIREEMTALVSLKVRVPVINRKLRDNGTVELSARLKSEDITSELTVRELGVPAWLDGEEPVLLGYDNAGDGADTIPVGGGSEFVSHLFRVGAIIGNADNIVIHVTGDGRLDMAVDYFLSTEGQTEFVPRTVDPYGACMLFVEGIAVAPDEWQVVDDTVKLSNGLEADKKVWLTEVRQT